MQGESNQLMQPAVLITGASQRIGRALALAMAEEGYTILLHYRHSRQEAQTSAKEVEQAGANCVLLQADLSELSQVKRLLEQSFEVAPGCNVLINNASQFEANSLMKTTEAQFEAHFSINLKAPFFLTQGFAERCQEEGLVINMLDTHIQHNTTPHFAYLLSKKALYDFTTMAAKELAPKIRVNGICPGLILPPKGKDIHYLEAKSQTIPLQHYGDVSDIVQSIRFVVNNRFITGDCLFLDGGEHLT